MIAGLRGAQQSWLWIVPHDSVAVPAGIAMLTATDILRFLSYSTPMLL